MEMLTPHVASVRQSARILAVHAVLAADKGDTEQATAAVNDMLELAQSVRHEPVMISQLVRIACEAIGVGIIERILARTSLPNNELLSMEQKIASIEDQPVIADAYIGERCASHGPIRSGKASEFLDVALPGTTGPSWIAKPMQVTYQIAGLHELDALWYLNLSDAARTIVQRPLDSNSVVELRAIGSRAQRAPPLLTATRAFTAGFEGYPVRELRVLAQKRCMRAALAVERYRNEKGKLPDKLEELVPLYLGTIPIDPFSSQPVRFKPQAKGYLIYSFGEDLKDDSGSDAALRGIQPDIVIHIER
jgi:hypothetical protein